MKRLFLFLLLLMPLLAWSAKPADDDPPLRAEFEDRIETVIVARLTKLLEIHSDQAKLFFPLLNEFQTSSRQMRREQMDLQRKLKKMGDPASATSRVEVDRLSAAFLAIHRKQIDGLAKFIDDAGKILEPWQTARLQLFMMRFPERVQELIRDRMMEERRGGPGGHHFRGGMGEPPPPGDDPEDK